MLLNYKKKIVLMSYRQAVFRSQRQWKRMLLSLTNPMAMRTQLGFKLHRESHSSHCAQKLWFQHLLVNNFTGRPSLMDARGAHKRHHGYYYSYHRVLN